MEKFFVSEEKSFIGAATGVDTLTFNAQLSRMKIPKVQKDTLDISVFLGSSQVKALHKMLVKLTHDYILHSSRVR
jgi:hypothetical protein